MRKPKKSAKMWVARDSSGKLYLYKKRPYKLIGIGLHAWGSGNAGAMKIDPELFPDVKWEDEEPTQVTLRI